MFCRNPILPQSDAQRRFLSEFSLWNQANLWGRMRRKRENIKGLIPEKTLYYGLF
jgi:hypothetical protein